MCIRDRYDTVDWLLKNIPNNNGKVGIWGISYPGFYTSASIIDSHPAIKAASPEAPMTNLFMGDDAYHGGAFMLSANFGFYTFFRPQPSPTFPPKNMQRFDYGTQDGYDFYLKMGSLSDAKALYFKDPNWLWNDQVAHDTYDDYWKARNLAPHMKNVHCAVLTVGGWFDAEDLQGPFSTFAAIGRNNCLLYTSRAAPAHYNLPESLQGSRSDFFWAIGAPSPFPFVADSARNTSLLHVAFATAAAASNNKADFARLLHGIRLK